VPVLRANIRHYFGFYATGSASVASITVSTTSFSFAQGGTEVGGFGIDQRLPQAQAARTISSFSRAQGRVGTRVTMTGANFTRSAVKSVTFNDVSASFIVRNATTIVAKVPVGATTGPIRVKGRSTTSTSLLSFKVWRFRP